MPDLLFLGPTTCALPVGSAGGMRVADLPELSAGKAHLQCDAARGGCAKPVIVDAWKGSPHQGPEEKYLPTPFLWKVLPPCMWIERVPVMSGDVPITPDRCPCLGATRVVPAAGQSSERILRLWLAPCSTSDSVHRGVAHQCGDANLMWPRLLLLGP